MTECAYIHIPFCKSKCNYCSFVSYEKLQYIDEYINSLLFQIDKEYEGEKLNTLYIGGGTPSLLDINSLKKVINKFKFSNTPEITIEVNPNDLNENFLTSLKNIGINRLSIGVQTFDDNILKLIGRRHNSSEAKKAIQYAVNAGFKNISLDFIYGLPNQTLEGFVSDLRQAMKFPIQHISLYGLKIDSGCFFADNMPKNLPDDDLQADMYLKAIRELANNNFQHYEVSNFAKEGYYSKHNLNYWNAEKYYGFGCAASGYLDDIRYTNLLCLEDYIKNPLEKSVKNKLSKQERLEESIFLGLRKCAGIDINCINDKFNVNFENDYSNVLKKYSKYFIKTKNGYAFNKDGLLISNIILAEFLS